MPPPLASEIFDFIECHPQVAHERIEFADARFGSFRRSVRSLAIRLRKRDELGLQLSTRIGAVLCEVLTVPMAFDSLEGSLLEIVGSREIFQKYFGTELAETYGDALNEAQSLRTSTNLLRQAIAVGAAELQANGRIFKIYCHRRARVHFESAMQEFAGGRLSDSEFLHTPRDYRKCSPFHTVLKVGPLRSFGWGSAPDALLSAPRFERLAQYVWSGCDDEPGFGYDPVDVAQMDRPASSGLDRSTGSPRQLSLTVSKVGSEPSTPQDVDDSFDEFKLLAATSTPLDTRSATLVQISNTQGVLFPRFARVMSFDPRPTSLEPIERRTPAESLEEGMYLIVAKIEDLDLGSIRADHGQYSALWKRSLREAWENEPEKLLELLRADGLSLSGLASAIVHWCRPPSTVIHAPRELRHFEILLQVLNRLGSTWPATTPTRVPFWRLAWNEVRSSRGEAIQAGFQEHEFVEDELIAILRRQIERVREKSLSNDSFTVELTPDQGISGKLDFNRVYRIEEGFNAPESSLKCIAPIEDFDQWRA